MRDLAGVAFVLLLLLLGEGFLRLEDLDRRRTRRRRFLICSSVPNWCESRKGLTNSRVRGIDASVVDEGMWTHMTPCPVSSGPQWCRGQWHACGVASSGPLAAHLSQSTQTRPAVGQVGGERSPMGGARVPRGGRSRQESHNWMSKVRSYTEFRIRVRVRNVLGRIVPVRKVGLYYLGSQLHFKR